MTHTTDNPTLTIATTGDGFHLLGAGDVELAYVPDDHDIARRLCAAWNATRRISVESLEAGMVEQLIDAAAKADVEVIDVALASLRGGAQ